MSDRQRSARFTDLYLGHYDRVLRFIARRTRYHNMADAEDITAEVFRIAWTRALEGDSVTPGWLFVTARNLLRSRDRSVHRDEAMARAMMVAAGASTHGDEANEAVVSALRRIDDRHREILVLRYWDELSTAEIAALWGVSPAAVWVRAHRARRAFRESFTLNTGGRDAND